jgi:hypothetical protein
MCITWERKRHIALYLDLHIDWNQNGDQNNFLSCQMYVLRIYTVNYPF